MSRLLACVILLTSAACATSPGTPIRSVEQVVRSTAQPRITVTVAPELSYLGHIHGSAMSGRAVYDQYIFSELNGGQLGRTFIVHFESAVPGTDFAFDYPRQTMVRIGRHEYLQQSWPIENWPLFQSDPMTNLLRKYAATAPSRWLVNRYVRAVGKDKRAEIILFYLEPAGELPAAVPDLGLGGPQRDLWEPIAAALATRAKAVFALED